MPAVASTRLDELLRAVDAELHPDEGSFVGRAFVRAAITRFLAVNNRMLVLVGPPGVGKTALIAALAHERANDADFYLPYFCGLNANPFEFCSTLGQLLHDQLGDGYALPETAKRQEITLHTVVNVGQAAAGANVTSLDLTVGGMPPREAFRQIVSEPLRAYDAAHGAERTGKPLIILLDGLDRAWEWDGGQGANIVSILLDVQDLPPWVNLICTARPGPAVQVLRAQAGVQVFKLDPDGTDNLADVQDFFHDRFLDQLDPTARAHFDTLLAASRFGAANGGQTPTDVFVRAAVAASEGNFLFVRRYVDAWIQALTPAAGQPASDPADLLQFDVNGSLATALDTTYACVADQLRPILDANQNDADRDVLAALSVAFAPVNVPLLACMTGRAAEAVEDALGRLAAVIETRGDLAGRDLYTLYHCGFAEFMRRQLPQQGRTWDVRIAHALEDAPDEDPQTRTYSALYRWPHLLRGLEIGTGAPETGTSGQQDTPAASGITVPEATPVARIAQIQGQVADPATQAQLLRGLAARALAPSQTTFEGSWSTALSFLRTAEKTLSGSRALMLHRRAPVHGEADASPELVELEQTLVALGDAYTTIVRRMDGGSRPPSHYLGVVGRLGAFWDTVIRLPLALYLLAVLILEGVREIQMPGALQNLGRAQDWAVARLCVLSVSAYRRAVQLARERGADAAVDDINERLAGVYALMGAYTAADAAYESLLARPSTIERPWRQATWRLALGEVMIARRRADRAVELLTSALPTFVAQQAPLHKARTLSAIAAAHEQQAGRVRNNGHLSALLDDRALTECSDALTAWKEVANLPGDELNGVDPALGLSNVGHQLWRASINPRLDDREQRMARELLDQIPERHFPLRFQHPALRLFRLVAAVLLPAVILFGLLRAVQLPSTVEVRPRTGLTFEAPLLDLSTYPNRFIGDTSTATTLSLDELNQLAATSTSLRVHNTTPALDPRAITSVVLLALAVYLLLYTAIGFLLIRFSAPDRFQSRLPGRLLLRQDSLVWQGPTGRGSLGDALEWLRSSDLWQRIRRRFRLQSDTTTTAIGAPPNGGSTAPAQSTRDIAMPFSDIAGTIVVNRSIRGQILPDFSWTELQPRDRTRRSLVIPGMIARYDELGSELERRLHVPRYPAGVEMIGSPWGVCFLATLLYVLALVVLLQLWPEGLHRPLPYIGYSLSSLYVMATPGLLLPLIWWFVMQPVGLGHARSALALPLAVTSLAGIYFTAVVFGTGTDPLASGLRPDLASPLLAGGMLATLVYYAPPRPLRFSSIRLGPVVRVVLALAAALGLALVGQRVTATLTWYNALVHGNTLVERALTDPGCQEHPGQCGLLTDAIRYYDNVICTQPGDSDGYAFRGFAYLVQGDYTHAGRDFQSGLRTGQPGGVVSPRGCAPVVARPPTRDQQVSLRGNLGAVATLHAMDGAQPKDAETYYATALHHYARALKALDGAADFGEPASVEGVPAATGVTCGALAEQLIGSSEPIDLVSGAPKLVRPAALALQIADTCYSRGFMRAQALKASRGNDSLPAYDDLAAAIAVYRAVADGDDRSLVHQDLGAVWLALSEINPPPLGKPDRRTALSQALHAYQTLDTAGGANESVYAAEAWSAIQLGAWDLAKSPLARLGTINHDKAIYPALQGIVAWLDSTQYPLAFRNTPSPAYSSLMAEALADYSEALARGGLDLKRAYATRSLLFFNLRNSPRATTYADEDFGARMHQAIADMDQALIAAEQEHRTPAERVGYRYWRGRLSFALALTWQEKLRGQHSWAELLPLYSSAFDDFTSAAAVDPIAARKRVYTQNWIDWAGIVANNATHMAQAEMAIRKGDFGRARSELELVNPRTSSVAQWDRASAPVPDYHYMLGLATLALDQTASQPLSSTAVLAVDQARTAYRQAMDTTEDGHFVPKRGRGSPDDARIPTYQAAIDALDRLLADTPTGWPAEARSTAQAIRAELQTRLGAIPR